MRCVQCGRVREPSTQPYYKEGWMTYPHAYTNATVVALCPKCIKKNTQEEIAPEEEDDIL